MDASDVNGISAILNIMHSISMYQNKPSTATTANTQSKDALIQHAHRIIKIPSDRALSFIAAFLD